MENGIPQEGWTALDVGLHRHQASGGLGQLYLEGTHSSEHEGGEVVDEVVHAMLLLRYCHDPQHHPGR